MIQVIEVISRTAVTIAFLGLIASACLLYFYTRKKSVIFLVVGLGVAEVGRFSRIFFPSYLTEPREGAIRLVDEAAMGIFLVQNLLMPTGLLFAMVGLGVFASTMRGARGQ